MSKESKSRDRFRQSVEAVRDRPENYCVGCGYYLTTQGRHRADCTKPPEDNQEATRGA